jgi:hypothetical protein
MPPILRNAPGGGFCANQTIKEFIVVRGSPSPRAIIVYHFDL